MMRLALSAALAAASFAVAADIPKPTAAVVGLDGRVYVASQSGAVLVVADGKATPFATGFDGPTDIVSFRDNLFVTDAKRVARVDRAGKVETVVEHSAVSPVKHAPGKLAIDEKGTIYLATTLAGGKGAVYKLGRNKAEAVKEGLPALCAIAMDGMSNLLLRDEDGNLVRFRLTDGSLTPLLGGLGRGGMAWDWYGRLYLGDEAKKLVRVVAKPGAAPTELAVTFTPSALALGPNGKDILSVAPTSDSLDAFPAQVPGSPVDMSPLPIETEVAFGDVDWAGYKSEDDKGKPVALRPIVLTHAGDGSNRVFMATQQGVIHVLPNDKATKSKVFLDIQAKVRYVDKANEEGLLGLAFAPDYKTSGQFYVFYTDKKTALQNVVSRFRVSKTDPDMADPASEEELFRVEHKYWNHDGGTIAFGPDGMLYIALGDGGSANDPDGNGQNLGTLLGKILRIDVGRKGDGKPYAIPKDNPFVGRADAKPEIYAYGLRNVWRMAFDKPTGKLWAADVGQNLYEEINLIERGGNYGWSVRESYHPFGPNSVGPKPEIADPIWEYHHDVGKSITGGAVYRGKALPELAGHYLYTDYVTGKIWALKYDESAKRVVANRPIRDKKAPIMSFGEDEAGEAYMLTFSASGQGILRFKRVP